MNRILTICASLLIAVHCFSQTGEIKPITAKPLQAPNNATWYFNTPDTSVWIAMGVYGQLKLASNQQLVKYYVPYKGANDTLDLGSQLITSKKQLLPLFNGACSVPTILDNGDGSISVGNGEYHVSTRVDGKGTQSYLISGGIFSLTDNTTNYLVADYNNGTPILHVITDVNLINETTVVPIYTAYRSGTILHFQNWDALGVALANKVHQSIVKTQRYRRESGLGISEVATRYLSVGNGRVWVGAVPVSVDAIITSSDNLRLFYHSGGVWTYSLQTQYNNSQYDNGTNLVNLTANRYAVNWIFRGIESQKHLYIVLGRGDYTLAQAQEAVLPAIPTAISSHAMLIGKLIVQNGATTSTSIQSAFEVQFSTATPNAHNDLTGRDVADVHPAGSITFTPTGTYTATTVADALAQIDSKTVDRSITNELQTLSTTSSGTTRTITISSGNNVGIDVADNDNSTTNEIQAPTRVGDLIGLTQTTTTISIADKEPAFSKNTAFNKNFGTTAGTVLEGRTFGTAANNNTGDFIANGTSQQTGNFNISGSGKFGNNTTKGIFINSSVIGLSSQIESYSNTYETLAAFRSIPLDGINPYLLINSSSTGMSLKVDGSSYTPLKFNVGGYDALSLNPDASATFASTIQATTAKLTNLTDGYIPYHISDASGLANSPIYTDGTNVGIGTAPSTKFTIYLGNIVYGSPREVLISAPANYSYTTTEGIVGIAFRGSNIPYTPGSLDRASGIFGYSSDSEIYSRSMGLSFYTSTIDASATEKMRITSGGNVGIGYSSGYEITNNRLAVNGSGYFNGNITQNGLASNTLLKSDANKVITSISNAVGLPYNDGSGNFSYWNPSVQSLSGTTTTWTTTSGVNAKITITAATTIYMTGLVSGQTGNITITNPSTAYKLKFTGYTLKISPALTADSGGILLSGSSKTDVLSWYYDGDYVIINGTLSYQSFSY